MSGRFSAVQNLRSSLLAAAVIGFTGIATSAHAGFVLGSGSNYAVLYFGAQNHTLQITNVTVNGNVGVGGVGLATDSGPSTINGSLDFSASNSGQFSNNNASDVISNGVNYNVSAVTSAINTLSNLNASLGAEAGTNMAINLSGSTVLTINASSGVLDSNGNRVFNITGFNTTNTNTIRIVGDSANDSVVFNFIGLSANFNNQVSLQGLNSDQVLYNFVSTNGTCGGPSLQVNNNGNNHPANQVYGDFLDPYGTVHVTNANLNGRVFGGGCSDMQIVSGDTINAPPSQVPEPASLGLLGMGLVAMAFAARRRNRAGAALSTS